LIYFPNGQPILHRWPTKTSGLQTLLPHASTWSSLHLCGTFAYFFLGVCIVHFLFSKLTPPSRWSLLSLSVKVILSWSSVYPRISWRFIDHQYLNYHWLNAHLLLMWLPDTSISVCNWIKVLFAYLSDIILFRGSGATPNHAPLWSPPRAALQFTTWLQLPTVRCSLMGSSPCAARLVHQQQSSRAHGSSRRCVSRDAVPSLRKLCRWCIPTQGPSVDFLIVLLKAHT
jgi:hypothetical protein